MAKTFKFRSVVAAFLGFLIPGAGHLYWGYPAQAFLIIFLAIVATQILSFFAALGAWAMGVGFAANLAFRLLVMVLGYRLVLNKERGKMHWWGLVGFLVLLALHSGLEQVRRVRTYGVPTDSMAPVLTAGDDVAVDGFQKNPSQVKVGDFIIVEFGDGLGQYIREVRSIQGDHIEVAAKDPRIPQQAITWKNVRGKVLYITYSWAPGSFSPVWNRTLMSLP